MSNKYWKENDKGAWYLYFDPYNGLDSKRKEDIVLRMAEDTEDKGYWNYVSELLNVEQDWFEAEDLEEAKELAEDMIKEHYEDQIDYYRELIKRWNEE